MSRSNIHAVRFQHGVACATMLWLVAIGLGAVRGWLGVTQIDPLLIAALCVFASGTAVFLTALHVAEQAAYRNKEAAAVAS